MIVSRLLNLYERGAITQHELVARCLEFVDPENAGKLLETLPEQVLAGMELFINSWVSGRMVTTSGTLPTEEQVEAAREWIRSSHLNHLSQWLVSENDFKKAGQALIVAAGSKQAAIRIIEELPETVTSNA